MTELDLEYTPVTDPLPALASAAELDALRKRVAELEALRDALREQVGMLEQEVQVTAQQRAYVVARAEAMAAKLAAVPVAEIHAVLHASVTPPGYLRELQTIKAWLVQQGRLHP